MQEKMWINLSRRDCWFFKIQSPDLCITSCVFTHCIFQEDDALDAFLKKFYTSFLRHCTFFFLSRDSLFPPLLNFSLDISCRWGNRFAGVFALCLFSFPDWPAKKTTAAKAKLNKYKNSLTRDVKNVCPSACQRKIWATGLTSRPVRGAWDDRMHC